MPRHYSTLSKPKPKPPIKFSTGPPKPKPLPPKPPKVSKSSSSAMVSRLVKNSPKPPTKRRVVRTVTASERAAAANTAHKTAFRVTPAEAKAAAKKLASKQGKARLDAEALKQRDAWARKEHALATHRKRKARQEARQGR